MGRSNLSTRGPLPSPSVRVDETSLTGFAGAIPLIRFLNNVIELPQRLFHVVNYDGRKRKYGIHLVLFAFVVGALIGVERLAHLEFLRGDAVLLKFLRLPAWPVRKVFANAVGSLSDQAVSGLQELLTSIGLWSLSDPNGVIIDFDSSAIVSFGQQEGAVFGYCGKGRNRRRHHPLVASVAATRVVVNAKYRDGSAIDALESISFFGETVARIRSRFSGCLPTIRADSGFWSNPMGKWLLEGHLPFVMSFPLGASLKLMLHCAAWKTLEDDPDIELATLKGEDLKLDPRLNVVVIRRFVHDPKAPPQGKVVETDPNWRYQALVTSMDWEPLDVWRFYNDRGDCERVFKVGKHALGMGCLISLNFRANTVAFLLRMLAFNVDLLFQRHTEERARELNRPTVKIGLQARQRQFYQGVARLLKYQDGWVLRVQESRFIKPLWNFYAEDLLSTS